MFDIQIAFSFFLCFQLSISSLNCSLIPNCLQCKNQLQCTKCKQDYILIKDSCNFKKQKNQRFLQTTSSNLNTSTDPKNKTLTINQITLPSNKKMSNTGKFSFFSNPNSQVEKNKKCIYESKGICYICGSKYQMGIGGKCYPKFNKCLSFSKDLMCTKCDPHFEFENGSCIDIGCTFKNYYQCNKCKNGYKLNEYLYCVTLFCVQYQNGKCIKCLNSYSLKEDICIKVQIRNKQQINQLVKIENCNRIQNKKCLQCLNGYYLRQQKCHKIPILCKNFDYQTYQCRQCRYPGLILVKGYCFDPQCTATDQNTKQCTTCANGYILNSSKICQSTNKDQNCIKVVMNVCTQCKKGFFIGGQNKCQKFQDNCIDKQCLYCAIGYISIKNKCQKIINCSKILKNICQICQQGFSVTNIGTCIKSIQNCLKYTPSGCSSCPGNYILTNNNSCIQNKTFQDPNCISKNFRSECSLCKSNYRIEPKYKNLCVPFNRQCKTSSGSGECTSCYEGYRLNEFTGQCIIITAIQNCAEQVEGVCKRCAHRYYLISSISCKEVDSLCDGYNIDTGVCTSCYSGYMLFNGKCIVVADFNSIQKSISSKSNTSTDNKKNIKNQTLSGTCLIKDKNSNKCIKCYESFILNQQNGSCVTVNPLCKTHNLTTGSCQSCYEGYILSGTSCRIESKNNMKKQKQDEKKHGKNYRVNCKKIDDNKKQCLECLDRFYKQDKICQQVSPQCRTFNAKTGACTGCYTGYIIRQNQCVVINNQVVAVQNCQIYHPITLKCIKCNQNFVLKKNVCQQMPEGCLKYNEEKGQCAECLGQYMKNSVNLCIRPALGQIFNCKKYDDSGYCILCGSGLSLQNHLCIEKRR